jgi:nucleoside-diphosphate-sugar epimerase
MNILVTGANGFIGQAVCRDLSLRQFHVLPIVRNSSTIPNAIIIQDEHDPRWDTVLKECQTIVHLAGRAHVAQDKTPETRALYMKENVELTLNLAQKAADLGVKRFVFISSIKVNGEETQNAKAFTPEDVPHPQDVYAESKWLAEQGLMTIARTTNLEIVIIRPPLVYGPGVKGNFSTLIKLVKKGLPIPLGGIQNQRSLVALDNLSNFIALCADINASPKAANQVFLISDGEPVSTGSLIQRIADAYQLKLRLIPVPVALLKFLLKLLGKGDAAHRIFGSLKVNDIKARELLGWRPVVSMDEQLRKMRDDTMH